MKQTTLRNYAKLIARVGVNIQKGQDVIIYCQLDQPRFVEMLVDECYKAGAGKVTVEFRHQPLYKLDVRHQTVTMSEEQYFRFLDAVGALMKDPALPIQIATTNKIDIVRLIRIQVTDNTCTL